MTTLCSGKLLDKLRYLFSNLADTNGHMISERFEAFLRDVGRISSAVGEEKQRDVSFFSPLFTPRSWWNKKRKYCEMYYYTYYLVDSDGFFSLPDYLK